MNDRRLHWMLRIACAGCFIGHGAFGLLTKVEWLPFYFRYNVPPSVAFWTMPAVGTMDILLGLSVLFRPCPAALIWMTVWGFFTASLRPVAGQAPWELLERAGNFGVPLAYLLLSGWFEERTRLFEKIKQKPVPANLEEFARIVLVCTTGFLLLGHGALMAIVKKDLFVYQFLVLDYPLTKETLAVAGVVEMAMGLAVFFRQPPWFLAVIFLWKVLSECIYPLSGFPVWEFVERAGSYAAPLALMLFRPFPTSDRHFHSS